MKIKELTIYHEDDPSQTLVVLSMKKQTKRMYELDCEDHDGEQYIVIAVIEQDSLPVDEYCVTTPDGQCISNHPKCMHQVEQ